MSVDAARRIVARPEVANARDGAAKFIAIHNIVFQRNPVKAETEVAYPFLNKERNLGQFIDDKAKKAGAADADKKNLALYQTNRQLIAKYQQKSRWTALLQKEPFVGFKQVEIENQAQAFEHDNAEQLRNTQQDAGGMSD